MRGRFWASTRVVGPFRLIASRTGLRPALRGRFGQVSTRSAFLRFGPFRYFVGNGRRERMRAWVSSWVPTLVVLATLAAVVFAVWLATSGHVR